MDVFKEVRDRPPPPHLLRRFGGPLGLRIEEEFVSETSGLVLLSHSSTFWRRDIKEGHSGSPEVYETTSTSLNGSTPLEYMDLIRKF